MSVYLVVEPVSIIAMDLGASIREFDPSAQIIVAQSADTAVRALAGQDAVGVAFLHMDPCGLATGPLAAGLAARGAVCVFMGEAAERAAQTGILLLERPFSTATVADLLARIVPEDRVPA
ncbi:MAG: hypothetical protein V4516_12725 [Pseudomonadota bacterium]